MEFHKRKLLTIITESIMEDAIEQELKLYKISGYTILDARGSGQSGLRDANHETDKNIRIEAICTEEIAKKLSLHLKQTYYENYAMVLFLTDVEVLRPDKF
ncbi:transcriptional regulator [bacterium]|nr:transcriptional regulator [bacterium]